MKSAVCLTFDLDAETAWISRDPANIGRLSVMSQGAYGPRVGVPLILDSLDRNRIRTTFFIPEWTVERWSEVVAEIHRRDHEVGHHGYLHEGKTRVRRVNAGVHDRPALAHPHTVRSRRAPQPSQSIHT